MDILTIEQMESEITKSAKNTPIEFAPIDFQDKLCYLAETYWIYNVINEVGRRNNGAFTFPAGVREYTIGPKAVGEETYLTLRDGVVWAHSESDLDARGNKRIFLLPWAILGITDPIASTQHPWYRGYQLGESCVDTGGVLEHVSKYLFSILRILDEYLKGRKSDPFKKYLLEQRDLFTAKIAEMKANENSHPFLYVEEVKHKRETGVKVETQEVKEVMARCFAVSERHSDKKILARSLLLMNHKLTKKASFTALESLLLGNYDYGDQRSAIFISIANAGRFVGNRGAKLLNGMLTKPLDLGDDIPSVIEEIAKGATKFGYRGVRILEKITELGYDIGPKAEAWLVENATARAAFMVNPVGFLAAAFKRLRKN